jgi:hypothetical protein
MKKFLFCLISTLIFLSCLTKNATAAYVNWVIDSTTTRNVSVGGGGGGSSGTPSNMWDGDFGTSYGGYYYKGCCGDWGTTNSTQLEVVFPVPHDITQIVYKAYARGCGNGEYGHGGASWIVEVSYGGSYSTLWSGSGGNCGGADSGQVTRNGTWNNVTKLRITAQSDAGGDRDGDVQSYIYEFQAWGNNAVPPTVSTSDATNITSVQATLNGNITDTGGENVVERGFEWGTSPGNYTHSITELGSFGTGVFSEQIAGLNQRTMYYFRGKARNSAGWNYGSEKSFTTSCIVNYYDLAKLCEQWLQTGSGLTADLDGGGTVDFIDYSILTNSWLGNCPPDWPLK